MRGPFFVPGFPAGIPRPYRMREPLLAMACAALHQRLQPGASCNGN